MGGRHLKPRQRLAAIILTSGLLWMMSGNIRAEDAEDKLGNWIGVNSTVRFSDHWSIFGQGELRLWEPAIRRRRSSIHTRLQPPTRLAVAGAHHGGFLPAADLLHAQFRPA